MNQCTEKQLNYVRFLLVRHDEAGTLGEVIKQINPDMGENEDFLDWLARQEVRRASGVIETLIDGLPT